MTYRVFLHLGRAGGSESGSFKWLLIVLVPLTLGWKLFRKLGFARSDARVIAVSATGPWVPSGYRETSFRPEPGDSAPKYAACADEEPIGQRFKRNLIG